MNKITQQAFTLIELIVVVVIVAVLSGLLIVGMSSSIQSGNIAKVQIFTNNLKNTFGINLVSEWKLDEGSGTTLTDSWSGGNNGTLTCPTSTCWKSGSNCIGSSCVYLPGNDASYITVPDSNNLHFGDVTISFWVYNEVSANTYPTLINKHDQSSTVGFWWSYTAASGRTIRWQYSTGSAYASVSWSTVFPTNTWSHLTYTYDNTSKTVQLLINGISKGILSTPSSLPVTSAALYFGSYQGGTPASYAFDGAFDEIRIFNTVISSSEIKDQYFSGMNKLLARGQMLKEDYTRRLSELNNSI